MIAVIQRVLSASVDVKAKEISRIENGLLILLGVFQEDTEKHAEIIADKTVNLRIFKDNNDKMNLSLLQLKEMGYKHEILVVPQFTLCGNCKKGNRPEFLAAAKPDYAKNIYEYYNQYIENNYAIPVKTGQFRESMQVKLINDGPVTIILDSDKI